MAGKTRALSVGVVLLSFLLSIGAAMPKTGTLYSAGGTGHFGREKEFKSLYSCGSFPTQKGSLQICMSDFLSASSRRERGRGLLEGLLEKGAPGGDRIWRTPLVLALPPPAIVMSSFHHSLPHSYLTRFDRYKQLQ